MSGATQLRPSLPLAPQPLGALLENAGDIPPHVLVSDITLDSREVTPGAAFFACGGHRHHGLEYAREAAARGARAILWESDPRARPPALDSSILVREVPQLRSQLGRIADRFFAAPSGQLTIAAVTGTNGKTTCAWLLAQALSLLGRRAAYLGTLGVGDALGDSEAAGAALTPLAHTTPDVLALHRWLAVLRAQGFESVAMEVSSHALDQERCAGVRFAAAAFTNLTREHLDYHGDMQTYGAAKAKLLAWPGLAARVINIDDRFGAALAGRWLPTGPGRLLLTSRHLEAARARAAEYVCATRVATLPGGLQLQLVTSQGGAELISPLRGHFNVDNLLTVLALLLALEWPLLAACAALARCQPPPGRMQSEGGDEQPLVLIDYAHTPDALAQALAAARVHCQGRLWCVFGCGGDRDRGKRADMGRIAAAGADALIITDDNPRSEDPRVIAAAILQGAGGASARTTVIHDRGEAIRTALTRASRGDVVLIAGKGHEDYQLVGTERRAFSDSRCVRGLLAERRSS